MPYSVTPTLLDAADFLENCPPNWKDAALEGLTAKIQRKPLEPSAAILRGIDFETHVQRAVEAAKTSGKPLEDVATGSEHFLQVCRICEGATFQTWGQTVLDLEGYGPARCYGKVDAFFPVAHERHPEGLIIDLKTTGNYRGPKKYLSGWQHIFYTSFFLIAKFQYVVAEWADAEATAIKAIHVVETENDPTFALEKMKEGIDKFFFTLKKYDLWDDYRATYCKRKTI